MLFYTHLALAFLFGLIGISYFHPSNQILFIILVLFGGLLPDVDSSKSKLGSKVKVISIFFKHRGIFHSLLILPVIAFLLYYFGYSHFALPIIIGYVSHFVGDIVTKEGLMLLYPLSDFRIKGMIRTGGFIEKIIFIALLLMSGYFLLLS